MSSQITITLKQEYIEKYQNGYPLLLKEALVDWNKLSDEGAIVNLINSKKKFIAKGYFGIQNKGYGWILSSLQDEKIDKDFFIRKIKSAVDRTPFHVKYSPELSLFHSLLCHHKWTSTDHKHPFLHA